MKRVKQSQILKKPGLKLISLLGFDPAHFGIERFWSNPLKYTLLIVFYFSAYSAHLRTCTKLAWLQISLIEKASTRFLGCFIV